MPQIFVSLQAKPKIFIMKKNKFLQMMTYFRLLLAGLLCLCMTTQTVAQCPHPVKTSKEYLECADENELTRELNDRLNQQQQNNPAKKSSGPEDCTDAGALTQTVDPSFGAVSQVFGDFPDFDAFVADDFVTPQAVSCPEATIYLTSIAFAFTSIGGGFPGCADVQITIYTDGGGIPSGTIVTQETTPVDPHVGNFAVYNFTDCPLLMPGTNYWVEIVAIGDFALCGQEFLELSATEAGVNPAVFQNPGNGFGFGCTTWGNMVACTGTDLPNLAMELTFCEDESVCTCDPVIAGTPAPVAVVTSESTCEADGMTLSGGVIAAPTTDCATGSTLEYSTDNMNWSTTLPAYDQMNAVTVYTRCVCDGDVNDIGDVASVTTDPGQCVPTDAVPTVGEWGLIMLGLLMLITAIVGIRQRREDEVIA